MPGFGILALRGYGALRRGATGGSLRWALAAQKRAEEEAELARIRAEKARLAAEAKAREAQQRAAQAQYEAQEAQKGEHFEEEQKKGEMF